jgi:hypothetical protein
LESRITSLTCKIKLHTRSCLIDDGGGTDKEHALAASSNPSLTPPPSACPGDELLPMGDFAKNCDRLGQ